MTFKEKLKMEHPGAVTSWARGGCIGCPSTYGYEAKDRDRCPQTPECWTKERCTACWNREMPGTNCRGLRAKIHVIDELHGVPNLTENAKAKINEKIYLNPSDVEKAMNTDRVISDYIKMSLNSIYGAPKVYIPDIKKVIFNDPATIVIWADGEKTVVKCQNGESYDPEKGLAMAITKRALGNKGNYFDEIKKWTKGEA